MQKKTHRVIVIGGGLSGLTAADKILQAAPETQVTVFEAMSEVGGRTKSVKINDAIFDLGGTWVGETQKNVKKLAERSGNQLIPQYHIGRKILHIKKKVSSYLTNIPYDVGIVALIQMQFTLWKINRMANKVDPENPRKSELGFSWDCQTVRSWMQKNISFSKVKILLECAVRAVFGAETDQISFLFFLLYVRQNNGVENLINIENGLQQKKMIKGAQSLSLYLKQQIQKRNGKIILNSSIKKIIQNENGCVVFDQNGKQYFADYMIIAMPPARINKIDFEPQLSRERRFICQRNFMGSITKVLLLFDKPYWKQNGFSGETLSDCLQTPVFNAYDDSRHQSDGKLQPAIIVFLNASVDRVWSSNKQMAQQTILQTLASYFKAHQMLSPLSVHWQIWNEQEPLNGGPIAFFPPGVLTKIEDIRAPQGRIHWAGTQLARVSQGFMDGAIQSGERAADQIIQKLRFQYEQIKNIIKEKTVSKITKMSFWYQKIIFSPRKWFEWI